MPKDQERRPSPQQSYIAEAELQSLQASLELCINQSEDFQKLPQKLKNWMVTTLLKIAENCKYDNFTTVVQEFLGAMISLNRIFNGTQVTLTQGTQSQIISRFFGWMVYSSEGYLSVPSKTNRVQETYIGRLFACITNNNLISLIHLRILTDYQQTLDRLMIDRMRRLSA